MKHVGIVGLGTWGKKIALELEKKNVLASYADQSRDALEWARQSLSGDAYSYEMMLADPQIRGVIIATSISSHTALVRAALEAGKHVFVEKPCGVLAEETRALEEIARQRGVTLMVGYIYLYHPHYRAFKETIEDKTVTSFLAEWKKNGSFTEPLTSNLLTHHIAFAIDLCGMPSSIEIRKKKGITTPIDELETEFIYSDQKFISTISRVASEKKHSIVAYSGDMGIAEWEDTTLPNNKTPLELELDVFLEAVERNTPVPTDAHFAAQVLTVYEHVERLIQEV